MVEENVLLSVIQHYSCMRFYVLRKNRQHGRGFISYHSSSYLSGVPLKNHMHVLFAMLFPYTTLPLSYYKHSVTLTYGIWTSHLRWESVFPIPSSLAKEAKPGLNFLTLATKHQCRGHSDTYLCSAKPHHLQNLAGNIGAFVKYGVPEH